MNEFINRLYQNGDGCAVTGYYLDQPFIGRISYTRSTFSNGLNVYVDLDEPITIAGRERDGLVLDAAELYAGSSSVAHNLHVYF